MSTSSEGVYSSPDIIDFYSNHLKKFGDRSQGVGWKNEQAQNVRFVLAKIFQRKSDFSINDFGCGTCEFYKFLLHENFVNVTYHGYDLLTEMIELSKQKLGHQSNLSFHQIHSVHDLVVADYTIASVVFNVKSGASHESWSKHVLSTLDIIHTKSVHGFSFNMLTTYSDHEYMQPYLYYADPLLLFDYCKKNYSKNVALLHDYEQYDFTIIVMKR